jgi:hypothetical protein
MKGRSSRSGAANPQTQETFPIIPAGWIVCSCVICRSVLRTPAEALPSLVVLCPCGAEISIPTAQQFPQANVDQTAERLWADDESARERILGIDLSIYDELVTYPAGVDLPLERKKILFLQTALGIGIPWPDVVQLTSRYFGQTLHFPPMSVVVPIQLPPFTPPAFDIARQTPEQWSEAADVAWKAYRVMAVHRFQEQRQKLLDDDALREFDRPRRSSGIAGQKKAPITDELEGFIWAAVCFFSAQFGRPVKWADLAEHYPLPGAPNCPKPVLAQAKRKRAVCFR